MRFLIRWRNGVVQYILKIRSDATRTWKGISSNPYDLDFRIICRDGETRWIAHACQPVYNRDGLRLGRRASNRDIADRKKVEDALAESELLYRTLFEGARDAIIMIDLEGKAIGRIVSANPVAAKIHGYSVDEFTTLRLEDLGTSDSVQGLSGRVNTALSGELVRGEAHHRRKDGSVFPLEISANLVEIHGHKYCIGIDRDISERKLAEETIAGERSKFKPILDHMVDGCLLTVQNLSQHNVTLDEE
jgi:PAS domain S-box-containing protein